MMESYDVAVRLTVDENDQGLVGSQITGVRIPFPDDIDHLIEAQAWISKSLELTDYTFTPDVEVKSFTPGPGFIDVTFDSPYTITSEGVYVGYSFEMDEKVSKPITTISGTQHDAGDAGAHRWTAGTIGLAHAKRSILQGRRGQQHADLQHPQPGKPARQFHRRGLQRSRRVG